MNANCVVLAAGMGTRMKSEKPKVLCEILFKPMVNWVTDNCLQAGLQKQNMCYVLGYKKDEVLNVLGEDTVYCLQQEQLGTGHAVQQAQAFLEKNKGEHTLIVAGDAPFLDAQTIESSYKAHIENQNSATVITALMDDPTGYGRIVKRNNVIQKIVEQKDASLEEKAICEVNSGAYWFVTKDLLAVLGNLKNDNVQSEYYLTDVISLLIAENKRCATFVSEDPTVILGANDRKTLYELGEMAQRKIIERHMENGVEFINTDGVVITPDVKIGCDTVVYPGTILKGETQIGCNCQIGPNSLLEDSTVGNESVVNATQVYQSKIDNHVKIGPFSHVRPNSHLHSKVKVGDFVEVKNSSIGEGTSLAHLTYIGDSDIGKHTNFGCGVVTVNYDGENKARTTVGDYAFIGCNTNLIAPVTVGKGAYTAAGSTINKDVPDGALAIARDRQTNYPNWAENKLQKYIEKKNKK